MSGAGASAPGGEPAGNAVVTRAEVVAWLRAFAAAVAERRDELTDLDAAIGDADHGTNMDRGMKAVVAKLDEAGEPADPDAGEAADAPAGGGIGGLLKSVGMTLVSTVGGAAGPLYGTFFLRMAAAAGERDRLTTAELADAFAAGVEGVRARGKADLEDKTMVDALVPAAEALAASTAAGPTPAAAVAAARDAAEQGMLATIPLVARKGRASYLGERSAGHQDPGATSSWLLLATAASALAGKHEGVAAEALGAGESGAGTP
jgi:phosphoenolpyruvate---glycerone phosphotransferase subunit DhaL